jgi:hypothetical protein
METRFLTILAAFALVAGVPTAAADDVAGASGQCFDAESGGGNAHLAVTDEGEVEQQGLADTENEENNPPEDGAVDAVVALTNDEGQPEEGNGCTSEDDQQQDFLEAHAAGAQVCYDGEVNVAQPGDENPCPQRA